jgi:hypothetical protein
LTWQRSPAFHQQAWDLQRQRGNGPLIPGTACLISTFRRGVPRNKLAIFFPAYQAYRARIPTPGPSRLTQYLAGHWDDVLLTAEQGLSAATISHRRFELPLLHLAAACVPAGRGVTEEAERHARLAEEAAASVDYGQERVYAAMARALVCQGSGDYLGMADALGPWRDGSALGERSRLYAGIWRPLLAEGMVGSGQRDLAAEVLDQLDGAAPPDSGDGWGQAHYLRPGLAWLRGWLAEQQDRPEQALQTYADGEQTAGFGQSPVYTARLLLAHGRLLRRTGHRTEAIDRLRRARALFAALRAAPFIERTDQELAACHLPRNPGVRDLPMVVGSEQVRVAAGQCEGVPSRSSSSMALPVRVPCSRPLTGTSSGGRPGR